MVIVNSNPSKHSNDNETYSDSTTREEENLQNSVLVDQIKHLADQFKSVNVDKDEELEEAGENIMLNEEVTPMAKLNCDDKQVQQHDDKLNKIIERNNQLSNQFVCMCQCADVNEL